jgi:hypothetical protein
MSKYEVSRSTEYMQYVRTWDDARTYDLGCVTIISFFVRFRFRFQLLTSAVSQLSSTTLPTSEQLVDHEYCRVLH